jgi:hypothetical protein
MEAAFEIATWTLISLLRLITSQFQGKNCIRQLRLSLSGFYLPAAVRNCSYMSEQKGYCQNIVKPSKLLDEMARKARTEALRIEAARHETKRLLLRRKTELAELAQSRKPRLVAAEKA